MDLGAVSSDAVIESYRRQLSDAHHQISLLEAQLNKAIRLLNGEQQIPVPEDMGGERL